LASIMILQLSVRSGFSDRLLHGSVNSVVPVLLFFLFLFIKGLSSFHIGEPSPFADGTMQKLHRFASDLLIQLILEFEFLDHPVLKLKRIF
jgi:hypothetical protein